MARVTRDLPELPQAPVIPRRLELYPWQIAGVAFFSIIILLALFGFFGETRATKETRTDVVSMSVSYPTAFRYKTIGGFNVSFENESDTVLEIVTVSIDAEYLSQFSGVSFTPAPARVTKEEALFEFQDIAPGESRIVSGQLQAEEYGMYEGAVIIESEGGEERIEVETIVFP